MRGLLTFALVLAVMSFNQEAKANGYDCGGGDVDVGGGFSIVEEYSAPVVERVVVQRQVQYYSAPAPVVRYYSAPVVRRVVVPAYGYRQTVVGGYGGARFNVAVDAGRQRRPFGLRFRLNRAADRGASSVLGQPVRLVR